MAFQPAAGVGEGVPQHWAAAHAIHYHALKALAPEWAAAEPRRIPEALRPMPLEQAVAAFDVPHDSVAYRVGVARLAHAAITSGKPELHAHLDKAISRLPDGGELVRGKLQQDVTPEHAFRKIEHAVRSSSGDAGGCEYHSDDPILEMSAQYGWARVACAVKVNRPLDQFIGAGDPRHWKDIAPETFVESRELPGGTPTEFLLREHARWAPSGSVLSEYQNDLQIHYVAPPEGGMTLAYKLQKSISLDVSPLYTGEGGLSIDSGDARIAAVPGEPGFTTIAASKKLRHAFPNDDTVAIVLNYMSLPAMAVLMDRFVVGGACP
jgi:hypothetical protein